MLLCFLATAFASLLYSVLPAPLYHINADSAPHWANFLSLSTEPTEPLPIIESTLCSHDGDLNLSFFFDLSWRIIFFTHFEMIALWSIVRDKLKLELYYKLKLESHCKLKLELYCSSESVKASALICTRRKLNPLVSVVLLQFFQIHVSIWQTNSSAIPWLQYCPFLVFFLNFMCL